MAFRYQTKVFAAATWLLSGCDADLSRFDQVKVGVGGIPAQIAQGGAEAQPIGDTATATGGAAGGTTGGTTSGAGGTTGGDSGGATGGSAGGGAGSGSGTGAPGGSGTATGTATATAPPVAPSTLITTAGNAGGADGRYAAETDLFFVWSGASAAAGIRDYTVAWFAAAGCAGTAQTVVGLTAQVLPINGSDGQTYSFRVTVFDQAGAFATSACSAAITVETTPPPDILSLTAATGDMVGTNLVSIGFGPTSDYDHVQVRRAVGATPPDCSPQSGAIVQVLKGAGLADGTFVDYGDAAGQTYSYRACMVDGAGNLTASAAAPAAVTKSHVAFVSSTSTTSNLGGLAGADAFCAAKAAGGVPSVVGDPYWRAVLSDAVTNAKDRLAVLGPVLAPDLATVVASSAANLWTPGQASSPAMLEMGLALGGPTSVWTGTTTTGLRDGSGACGNWSGGGGNVFTGDALAASSGTWLASGAAQACGGNFSLYCISQPFPLITAAPAGSYTVGLTITLPATLPAGGSVTVMRRYGASAPNSSCAQGSPLSQSFSAVPGSSNQYVDGEGIDASDPLVSYRACVFDGEGNVVTSSPAAAIVAVP